MVLLLGLVSSVFLDRMCLWYAVFFLSGFFLLVCVCVCCIVCFVCSHRVAKPNVIGAVVLRSRGVLLSRVCVCVALFVLCLRAGVSNRI